MGEETNNSASFDPNSISYHYDVKYKSGRSKSPIVCILFFIIKVDLVIIEYNQNKVFFVEILLLAKII